MKKTSEAFRSDGATTSEKNDKNDSRENKVDDHDDDDDITTKPEISSKDRVRLMSMSKAGSGKEMSSDKERMKAGMMTTNKKVSLILCSILRQKFCPLRGLTPASVHSKYTTLQSFESL